MIVTGGERLDNRFEKSFGTLVMIGLGILAVLMLGRSYRVVTANGFERGKEILEAAYGQAAECALRTYLPQIYYDEKNPGSGDFFDRVIQQARKQIPGIGGSEPKKEKIPEILEDDSTEAAILEENERMIQAKMTEENQQKAEQLQQEEQKKQEEEEKIREEAETASRIQQTGAVQIVNPIALDQLQNFDYLVNNFFVVDSNTTAEESQINLNELWNRDMRITTAPSSPQILIYHTHSQEEFADSVEGDTDTTVIGVGNYLTQILQDTYGYNVIHLTDTFDLVDGQLERSKAYNYAEPVIQQVLNENPSIEVVIDLHRDGVDESKHLVTEIDGKPTAKIMFFNGLSRTRRNGAIDYLPNPYIEDNLAFSFQLEYLAKQCYPDFTRCIYLKGYRYNLHVRPKSLLLEVGAQTNTVEEIKNAMEPFAKILNAVLQGTNKTAG
jgi:stage II sporulation protein P